MLRRKDKSAWKTEFDNSLYKVYDWNKQLAGYFFPHYGQIEPEERQDEAIEELNKSHAVLTEGGTLLVPMLRLNLLDSETALGIQDVVGSLKSCQERAQTWLSWLQKNSTKFSIIGAGAHTAREDRNMLSTAIGISGSFALGEKEIAEFLRPLLDQLHEDGLL